MPYPYEQIFAGDPASPEKVASNGVVTIFAPGDPNRTPLTITTLDGLSYPNPVQVNESGHAAAFAHATLDQVAWAGGGLSGLFVSYKGIKDEAVAARDAASNASTAAQEAASAATDAAANANMPTQEAIVNELTNSNSLASKMLQETFAMPAEIVYNVKRGGVLGNGTTEDTARLDAFLASIPSPPNAFGEVSQRVHFPAGRYILGSNLVLTKRMTISGDGPYATILYRKKGATEDFVTLKGSNSTIRDLTLDGNSNEGISGDNLVIDAAWATVNNCTITNAAGNGITIGKTASGIGAMLHGVLIRGCKGYGVRVMSESKSTDGMWTNVDVGTCGLSGVRVDDSAQNMVNVHTWGCGVRASDVSDANGFYITSSSNSFTNCQAETNRGRGWYISGRQSSANGFVNCSSWGNRLSGWYILNAPRGHMVACKTYNNGVDNNGTDSVVYSGIHNEGGRNWTFSANQSFDSAASVPAGSSTSAFPYPYPGRTAKRTQTAHYVEREGAEGKPDNNTFTGNNWQAEVTLTGVAVTVLGVKSAWSGNHLGSQATPEVVAASTIWPLPHSELCKVTGSAEIRTITPHVSGSRLTLRFDGVGRIVSGGNVTLSGAVFAPTGTASITLICDGVGWIETSRMA